MDIKNLELTENDFKLLVEGLDSLPNKELGGEILGELMMGMLTKDKDTPELAKYKADKAFEAQKKKIAKEALIEEIKILQGKLLMFKRYLIQIDALKQVDDLLKR